jgi:glycosyltransferase involved in cell wall biosynthesis
MPSIVETVGLPMLEAAACGLPVVAADRPYARDVCAEAAAYFDPLDPKSLAATLETVIRSDALRARLRERGASLVAQRRRNRPYTRLIDLVMGIDR